jgi:uncharacterized protein (DUF1330 family)
MPAYVLGHLRKLTINAQIIDYLQRIDATLEPFAGRFLAHGGETQVLEGNWRGRVVIIEFPDLERAKAWYDSPAYQALIPLRTAHSEGESFLVAGVPDGYRAADAIPEAREQAEK